MQRELSAITAMMRGFEHPWAVCGGWAIDLWLNRLMRPHKDVDILIWRRDQLAMQAFLNQQGWAYCVAHQGALLSWERGQYLELPYHTLWCSPQPESLTQRGINPDLPVEPGVSEFLEVLLNENDGQRFLYRRDSTITLPVEQALISAPTGIPILAPEIVLLYKSNNPAHPGNAADFANALPALNDQQKAWLKAALQKGDGEHIWIKNL